MSLGDVVLTAIVADFLQPTMDRLAQQLERRIDLEICLKLPPDSLMCSIYAGGTELTPLGGVARISASESAVPNRYKYNLQCIFQDGGLDGFSGLRLKGAVVVSSEGGENDYSGFAYTYNEWSWSAKLRDF